MRVLISPMSSYVGQYGGIAYVGVFSAVGDYYKPALVFPENLAKNERYIKPLEVRLVRDALRAVLTAHELGLPDNEIIYAQFRHLVEELGYRSVDAGFVKAGPDEG